MKVGTAEMLREALVELGVEASLIPVTFEELNVEGLRSFVAAYPASAGVVAELWVVRRLFGEAFAQIDAYEKMAKDKLDNLGRKLSKLERNGVRVSRHRRSR